MDDIFSFLTELASAPIRRLISWRGLAMVLAAALSFGTYQIVANQTDNDVTIQDIFSFNEPDTITFFSGALSGDYYLIVDSLKVFFDKKGIILNNGDKSASTSAGYQNAVKVWQEKNSFGFVQKQAFGEDDYILNNVDLVTPVYTEQLHIIGNNERLFGKGDNTKSVTISLKTDLKIIQAIFKNYINVGSYGSGAQWVSSHIIEMLTDQIPKDSTFKINTKQLGLDEASVHLFNETSNNSGDSIGIIIFMTAPATKKVQDIINDPNAVIINLDPSFVVALKERYKLDIRPTEFFCVKYDATQRASKEDTVSFQSLGTYTYLVTGKNTSLNLTNKIISSFQEFRDNINSLKIDSDTVYNKNPLHYFYEQVFFDKESINFKDIFDAKKEKYQEKKLRVIFIFFISVILSIIPFYVALVWIFSGFNYWRFLNVINKEIYRYAIPNNVIPQKRSDLRIKNYKFPDRDKLDKVIHQNKNSNSLLVPYIILDQLIIINRVLTGMSNINKARVQMHDLLSNGGLTERHYNYVTERLDGVMIKLRKSLGLRINELVENENGDYKFWKEMSKEDKLAYILKLYTADYLEPEDYKGLCEKINPKKTDTNLDARS